MKSFAIALACAATLAPPVAAQVPAGGVLQMPITARFGFAFMNPKVPGLLDSVFTEGAKVISVDYMRAGAPSSRLGTGAKESAGLVEFAVNAVGTLDNIGCTSPVTERLVCSMTNKSNSVEVVAHLQNDRVDDAVIIIKRKAS